MSSNPLFVTIVLDGVGIGEAPDAPAYGDEGSDTLGHVLERCRPSLPNLTALGLGNIRSLTGVPAVPNAGASWGRLTEVSAGKDSTTGHWELGGLTLETPFPTYPDGFPDALIRSFLDATGCPRALGNRAASGTVIVDELGAEHMATGDPIVYTSADSVFQIATHVDVVPLETLYAWCRIARDQVCVGEHGVGRVIARPFTGEPGAFVRLSESRKDLARLPHAEPVQETIRKAGVRTVCVGKVADLFGGIGFDRTVKTRNNAEGIAATIEAIRSAQGPRFIWVNLIDFDQEFGHRNNPEGFAGALEQFDRALPDLLDVLPDGACMVLTADHGNDPTTASTDHAREYVPLLMVDGHPGRDVGIRASFLDHAATVADYFGVSYPVAAHSFLTHR